MMPPNTAGQDRQGEGGELSPQAQRNVQSIEHAPIMDAAPAWGEKGDDWPKGTYTYISGAASVRVWDGGTYTGGHDPLPYTGPHGTLPAFRDGTACRFDACGRCRVYGPVMRVRPLFTWRWLCASCCPPAAMPR